MSPLGANERVIAGRGDDLDGAQNDILFLDWVHGACRTLRADGPFFSAIASTRISVDSLEVPHATFAVEIPETVSPEWAGCILSVYDGSHVRGRLFPTEFVEGYSGCMIVESNKSLVDMANENPLTEGTDIDRIVHVVLRAAVGLCFCLQEKTDFRIGSTINRGGTGRQLREEPPPHRVIIFGRPLKVDVTRAVREYITHGNSCPSVQTLVRGHKKRQVFGPGSSLRKVIWIEPYWRGPEGAPILARAHHIGQ